MHSHCHSSNLHVNRFGRNGSNHGRSLVCVRSSTCSYGAQLIRILLPDLAFLTWLTSVNPIVSLVGPGVLLPFRPGSSPLSNPAGSGIEGRAIIRRLAPPHLPSNFTRFLHVFAHRDRSRTRYEGCANVPGGRGRTGKRAEGAFGIASSQQRTWEFARVALWILVASPVRPTSCPWRLPATVARTSSPPWDRGRVHERTGTRSRWTVRRPRTMRRVQRRPPTPPSPSIAAGPMPTRGKAMEKTSANCRKDGCRKRWVAASSRPRRDRRVRTRRRERSRTEWDERVQRRIGRPATHGRRRRACSDAREADPNVNATIAGHPRGSGGGSGTGNCR